MHTAPYFSAFGLLTIYLAARVIRLRQAHRVAFGDGGVPDLQRMIRIFGNFAEYTPMGLLLLIALEFVQAPIWFTHVAGTTLLMGRILHAIALNHGSGIGRGRVVGMSLTFFSLAWSSLGLLWWSFTGISS